MLEGLLSFAAITVGMIVSCAVGWQFGRLMSPRPPELRESAARLTSPGADTLSPPNLPARPRRCRLPAVDHDRRDLSENRNVEAVSAV